MQSKVLFNQKTQNKLVAVLYLLKFSDNCKKIPLKLPERLVFVKKNDLK